MAKSCVILLRPFYFFILVLASTASFSAPINLQVFDPLNEKEIKIATSVLKERGLLGHGWYLQLLALKEPSKDSLYLAVPSEKLRRQAFAIVINHTPAETYECVIDIQSAQLINQKRVQNGQPPLMEADSKRLNDAIKDNAEWQKAMIKRGFSDFSQIYIENWASGDVRPFKINNQHRVFRSVFYFRGTATNPYSRPIEGISVLTDMTDGMRVKVIDTANLPLPPRINDLLSKQPAKPIKPTKGSKNITINGHQVSWRDFKFHASIHPRDGLVISALSMLDEQKVRPILHRASLSEMVVPYADTDEHWYWKAAFDEGEYGVGNLTTSLQVSVHAPRDAYYIDAISTNNDGSIKQIPRAMAIFERDAGLLWSHYDSDANKTAARAGKELVLFYLFTVGNYDYGMQWILREDGTLELQMLLTGIVAAKGTELTYCARCQNSTDLLNGPDRFGTVIDTNLLGIAHQHFFNFRLDFAIDGMNNQVAEIDFEPITDKALNPHGNAFVIRKEIIASEKFSGRQDDAAKGRRWLIYNPNLKNRLGHFPGFMLVPGINTRPLAQPYASFLLRAPFLQQTLWVTKYHPEEMYAAGPYPSQGQGDGIPFWIKRNASLLNSSVVVWYTFGVTHLPSAEEWPVMPVTKAGFHLRPMGFFDRNKSAPKEPSPVTNTTH